MNDGKVRFFFLDHIQCFKRRRLSDFQLDIRMLTAKFTEQQRQNQCAKLSRQCQLQTAVPARQR